MASLTAGLTLRRSKARVH